MAVEIASRKRAGQTMAERTMCDYWQICNFSQQLFPSSQYTLLLGHRLQNPYKGNKLNSTSEILSSRSQLRFHFESPSAGWQETDPSSSELVLGDYICSGLPGTVLAYAGYLSIIVSTLKCVLVTMYGDIGKSPSQLPS